MTDGQTTPPRDQILIHDLRFRCIVGVNEEERHEKQDVVAQIALDIDLRQAGRTDALEDTVDYKALKKEILAMAERSAFQLIEALAQSIAEICLARERVERARRRLGRHRGARLGVGGRRRLQHPRRQSISWKGRRGIRGD